MKQNDYKREQYDYPDDPDVQAYIYCESKEAEEENRRLDESIKRAKEKLARIEASGKSADTDINNKKDVAEMTNEELYQWLQDADNLKDVRWEKENKGDDMAVIKIGNDGWWNLIYLVDDRNKTAVRFRSMSDTLLTVKHTDIDWTTVTPDLAGYRNALYLYGGFTTYIEGFSNNVGLVEWQINPDGRFFMDEDGFGMTHDIRVSLYGYIDRNGNVVEPFRYIKNDCPNIMLLTCSKNERDELEKMRKRAEKKVNTKMFLARQRLKRLKENMVTRAKALLAKITFLHILLLAVTASCTSRNGGNESMPHSAACKTTLFDGEYKDGEVYSVDTTFTTDGHFCISVNHKTFAYTEFYRLYSPEGNLLLIAAGASESVCIGGYAVSYNGDKIMSIQYTQTLADESYNRLHSKDGNNAEILKNWYDRIVKNKPEFTFKYDKNGLLYEIAPIEEPDYIEPGDIDVSIEECPLFWLSDVQGGELCFFAMCKEHNTERSSQNYLYADGRLAAELAFWKGTFIKLRTYNRFGQMVGVYDDRSIDVKAQVYEDGWNRPQWYVGEQ